MFIGDGAAIQVAWLQSATQLLRRPGLHDGLTEAEVWRSATFGAHWISATTTENGDTSAAVLEHPPTIIAATTENGDTSAAVLEVPHVIVATSTENGDTSVAELIMGHQIDASTTDGADTSAASFITVDVIEVGTIEAPSPTIGPSEIEINFNAEPIDLELGTILAPPLPTGPVSIVLEGVEPPPLAYAELLDTDGNVVSTLPEQFGLSWQEADSEPGAGKISVPMIGWNDATGLPYETDWAELIPGRVLRCYLYGVEAFSWQIERPPVMSPIDEDEEAGMIVTASGRGDTAVELASAVIDPAWTDADGNALNNPLNPSQRLYTFASDDFPRYDQWPVVKSVIPYTYVNPQRYQYVEVTTVVEDDDDIVTTANAPAPLGFPVTAANWIWPTKDTSIVGDAYMRTIFGIGPGPRQVSITATGDNFYTLYLNGTPIFGEIEDSGGWREFKTITLVLPAGYHTLAVKVENIAWNIGANPGGFICAVYEIDGDGVPTTVWKYTDATWTGLGYPAEVPGFTAAEIIFNMVFSAQVRGQLLDFDFDFTAAHDSAGVPWPYIPGIAFNVGDKILDALNHLHQQRWVDWRFKPGSRTLQMFVANTNTNPSGAVYTEGVDIRSLNIEEAEAPCNRLLVKWTRGYKRMNDTASQTAFGKIFEETLVVDTDDETEATRRAEAEFEVRADPKPAAIVDIEPFVDGDKPYVNYGVRDTVNSPYVAGVPTDLPVVSISVYHDDEGNPNITLELERRARIVEREELELLRQLGSGITGTLETSDALTTVRAISLVD